MTGCEGDAVPAVALADLSGGHGGQSTVLIVANARLAAEVAVALAKA